MNASKMHQTSLHVAARQDSVTMIELLLESGTRNKPKRDIQIQRNHLLKIAILDKHPFEDVNANRQHLQYIYVVCANYGVMFHTTFYSGAHLFLIATFVG